jgi:hypothetical protein
MDLGWVKGVEHLKNLWKGEKVAPSRHQVSVLERQDSWLT